MPWLRRHPDDARPNGSVKLPALVNQFPCGWTADLIGADRITGVGDTPAEALEDLREEVLARLEALQCTKEERS